MVKQAVILAGGFGTRLSHVVHDVPKPMALIRNKPFLDYQIELLQANGFDNFLILTGYKSEVIEDYYIQKKNIKCFKEEKPLGTGGAIINAYSELQDEFLVINGDTFFDIDFNILSDFSCDKEVVMALRYSKEISRYGLVNIDDNFNINNFIEKGDLPKNCIDGYINGGIYYIKKSVLKEEYLKFKNENISMENDVFPKLIENSKLFGLPMGGAFIDIGIPEDYYKAQDFIPKVIIQERKPALFIDKDGTLIVNTGYPNGRDIEIILPMVDVVKSYYDKGYKIIIVTNQAGLAKGKYEYQDMMDNIKAISDFYDNEGIKIFGFEYCPYHNDAKIADYKYISKARKPDPGMILQACEKTRINLSKSLMIGDNFDVDNIKLPYLKSIILGECNV